MDCDKQAQLITYLHDYSLDLLQTVNLDKFSDLNLTPSQIQLLNFLIVLTIKPKLLIIEDNSNLFSDLIIGKLFNECKSLQITVLTISNNDLYQNYHLKQLNLK